MRGDSENEREDCFSPSHTLNPEEMFFGGVFPMCWQPNEWLGARTLSKSACLPHLCIPSQKFIRWHNNCQSMLMWLPNYDAMYVCLICGWVRDRHTHTLIPKKNADKLCDTTVKEWEHLHHFLYMLYLQKYSHFVNTFLHISMNFNIHTHGTCTIIHLNIYCTYAFKQAQRLPVIFCLCISPKSVIFFSANANMVTFRGLKQLYSK